MCKYVLDSFDEKNAFVLEAALAPLKKGGDEPSKTKEDLSTLIWFCDESQIQLHGGQSTYVKSDRI